MSFIDDVYSDTDVFFPIDIGAIKNDFKMVENNKDGNLLSFTKWIRK